jgi:hypothetical protein
MGTANLQSQLWGARARDWAEVQEGVVAPLYEAVLHNYIPTLPARNSRKTGR